jgi:MoxR-like ATPase
MADETDIYEEEKQVVEKIHESRGRIERELSKVIVGQKEVSQQLLIGLFAGGHCLITGAPGLAKTLLVRPRSSRRPARAGGGWCSSRAPSSPT